MVRADILANDSPAPVSPVRGRRMKAATSFFGMTPIIGFQSKQYPVNAELLTQYDSSGFICWGGRQKQR